MARYHSLWFRQCQGPARGFLWAAEFAAAPGTGMGRRCLCLELAGGLLWFYLTDLIRWPWLLRLDRHPMVASILGNQFDKSLCADEDDGGAVLEWQPFSIGGLTLAANWIGFGSSS